MFQSADINKVLCNFKLVSRAFPQNEKSKNGFIAVCMLVDPKVDVNAVDKLAPYGGLIGPGDSALHEYLKDSKVLRVHAIFHDAYGFMKEKYKTGPGYMYMISNFPSHFLLGHISGIIHWTAFKVLLSDTFQKMPF